MKTSLENVTNKNTLLSQENTPKNYYVISPILMTSLTQMLASSDFFCINLVHTCDKFQGKSIRNGEVMEGEPNSPPPPRFWGAPKRPGIKRVKGCPPFDKFQVINMSQLP